MQTRNRVFASIVSAALLGTAGVAVADEALEDLDAPMTVFDTTAEIAGSVATMPRPDADPRGAAYNDAVPREGDDLYEDELITGPDRDTKREIQAQYDRELVDRVREGFIASPSFEGANQHDERLGVREDYFHIEEGEDVDVEDGFNDEDDVELGE